MTIPPQQIDANRRTINDNYAIISTKVVTFSEAENSPGDIDGTGNPYTLFTVSGTVFAAIFALSTDTVVNGTDSTLQIGVADSTGSIIEETNLDTSPLTEGFSWVEDKIAGAPAAGKVVIAPSSFIVSEDIIQTAGVADITAGSLTYYCLWRPLSDGASLT